MFETNAEALQIKILTICLQSTVLHLPLPVLPFTQVYSEERILFKRIIAKNRWLVG
jgi:hypothetical protein